MTCILLLLYYMKIELLILPLRLFSMHCHFLNCKPLVSLFSFYPSIFCWNLSLQLCLTSNLPLAQYPHCDCLCCAHLTVHTSLSFTFQADETDSDCLLNVNGKRKSPQENKASPKTAANDWNPVAFAVW